jgi:Skp family chaperone for outer membrane proteins
MKTLRAFLIISILAGFASLASAQGKVGIVDLRKLFDDYHKRKTADARLKEQVADIEKERKTMLDQYEKAREDYKAALDGANDQAVSADEREKRKKTAESKLLDIKRLEQDINTFDRQARTTLEEKERKYRDGILAEIRDVVTAKAKAAGYTLVVDSAAETINRTPVVMFTNGENDLTTAVLSDLNANAPASTGTPAPAPAKTTEKK